MRCSLIPSFVLILIFTDKPVLGKPAIVGGNFTLTASKNCSDSDEFKLTTAKDRLKTLARRDNGSWTAAPEGPYVGRLVHNSRSSLTLTNLNFKDNGHVVFVCEIEDFNTVELKVLAADVTTVTEGDTAVLFCHSSAAQVSWSKEGGEIRDREVFYKEDEASPGRFLLILMKVRLEDQGVYFCDASVAIKLIVNQRKPDQTTSTPSLHCNTTQSPNELNKMRPREIFSWVLVAVLFAVVVVLAIFLYLRKKKGRKPNESPEENGDPGQTGVGLLEVRNNNTDSDVNHHKSINGS